jgi:hypothetical protein
MVCCYCKRAFKKTHNPVYIYKFTNQSNYQRESYHNKCAKKVLYDYVIKQVQEDIVDLSAYRTTVREIWPKSSKLDLCVYNSNWFNQHYDNDINDYVRILESHIQQQIFTE